MDEMIPEPIRQSKNILIISVSCDFQGAIQRLCAMEETIPEPIRQSKNILIISVSCDFSSQFPGEGEYTRPRGGVTVRHLASEAWHRAIRRCGALGLGRQNPHVAIELSWRSDRLDQQGG